MHILIVNFNLHEMSHAEYTALCDEMAPTFAAVPGLVSKVWLSRPETNTYGGVYTWSDAAAFQAFRQSELFGAVAANRHFANVSANDFEILEGPSAVTRARTAVAAG